MFFEPLYQGYKGAVYLVTISVPVICYSDGPGVEMISTGM